MRTQLPLLVVIALSFNACAPHGLVPRGDYLGQTPPAPGADAALFAPGIVSTALYTRDLAMTPDGGEIYFGVVLGNFDYSTIMVTRRGDDGRWSAPEVAPWAANPDWKDLEPHVSPDGTRLFFMSDRPDPAAGETEPGDADIWVMERAGRGWTEPRNLGAPICSDSAEYFPSTTRDGTLYVTREDAETRSGGIYRSRRLPDGGYAEPERLGEAVNSTPNVFNAFVDPDERFLVVPTFGRDDSLGRTDYYVCFPDGEGGWEGPHNLGPRVNSPGGLEYSASLSPDGRVLFFMATRPRSAPFGDEGMTARSLHQLQAEPGVSNPAIWWIDAGVIDAAR